MEAQDKEIILECLEDMIEGHWKITHALLKLQRYLEQDGKNG